MRHRPALRRHTRPLALTLLALAAAAPMLALSASRSPLTGTTAATTASEREHRARTFTAWIPPGRYTAIVIATSADTRRWTVSLKSARGSFPIAIPPAQTTIIPFTDGWVVSPNDKARIESIDVPFDDIGRDSPLAEGNVRLSAWGITDTGPVPFVLKDRP